MRNWIIAILIAAVILIFLGVLFTQPDRVLFGTSQLTGDSETPPVETNASGLSAFRLNRMQKTLEIEIAYFGILSRTTGAHIHGPATEQESAGIIFDLEISQNVSEEMIARTWNYGEEENSDEIEDWLISGLTYINVHSEEFPPGEIRGQIRFE
jgi:hypothetical protein